jgi:hypothetical protein
LSQICHNHKLLDVLTLALSDIIHHVGFGVQVGVQDTEIQLATGVVPDGQEVLTLIALPPFVSAAPVAPTGGHVDIQTDVTTVTEDSTLQDVTGAQLLQTVLRSFAALPSTKNVTDAMVNLAQPWGQPTRSLMT